MKTKKFYDFQHASQWLVGGLVKYRDRPVFIDRVDSIGNEIEFKLIISDILDSGRKSIIFFPCENIDLTPVPLGMINWTTARSKNNQVYYSSRVTRRQWTIGLTCLTLIINSVPRCRKYLSSSNTIKSECLGKTIIGEFPSYEKAHWYIKKNEQSSMAFSRRFALSPEKKLYYNTLSEPVGKMVNNKIELYDDFFYLDQVLKEDVG